MEKLTYTNVNGYLIPNLTYKSGEQMEQLGKYGLTSIFTGTSISPDALSRQCSNHYAFRAGRNLPDKEFRYLRMVIVTTAVYRGLNSPLRPRRD